MPIRIAINGYGRIGQSVLRALYESGLRDDLRVVAINELSDLDTIAYLTRYDTTHGRFAHLVETADSKLVIDGDEISVYRESSPAQLPWANEQIDVVFDCTGVFGSRHDAAQHIAAGAKRVLFSHPADADVDQTIVYGLNHTSLSMADQIVSNASCTTNAIVPVLDVLDREFGIVAGNLTTIHSAMNDQPTIDAYHHRDLRRTRSAMSNMVPVDTALAKGISRLLPQMEGRFSAVAMRVPTVNVSAIDASIMVEQDVTIEEVNRVLHDAAWGRYQGILGFTQEPLASSDFNHDAHSGIIDGSQTRVSGKRLLKVLTWFDNEWGFANRMLDVCRYWTRSSEE